LLRLDELVEAGIGLPKWLSAGMKPVGQIIAAAERHHEGDQVRRLASSRMRDVSGRGRTAAQDTRAGSGEAGAPPTLTPQENRSIAEIQRSLLD
jgi:hypothetical protein